MPPHKRPSQVTLSGGARKAARVSVASTPSSSSSQQPRPPASQMQSQARPVSTAVTAREELQRLQYQQQQQYPTYEEDEHEVIDLTQAVDREEREFYGTLGKFFSSSWLFFLMVGGGVCGKPRRGSWSGIVACWRKSLLTTCCRRQDCWGQVLQGRSYSG
jgi:hypothetical protein